jgi:hypothetical protein
VIRCRRFSVCAMRQRRRTRIYDVGRRHRWAAGCSRATASSTAAPAAAAIFRTGPSLTSFVVATPGGPSHAHDRRTSPVAHTLAFPAFLYGLVCDATPPARQTSAQPSRLGSRTRTPVNIPAVCSETSFHADRRLTLCQHGASMVGTETRVDICSTLGRDPPQDASAALTASARVRFDSLSACWTVPITAELRSLMRPEVRSSKEVHGWPHRDGRYTPSLEAHGHAQRGKGTGFGDACAQRLR